MVGHEKMKYSIATVILVFIVGCSARPTPQEVFLRADGTIEANGAPTTDRQLRDLAMAKYRRHGSFPLTICADANVPLWRLAHIADIFRASGVWEIHTSRAQAAASAVLYPTFHTWGNEWKWHGHFAGSNSITAITTNAGVNVRLLPEGAQIESSSATMSALLDHLASLAGSDRARVVITANTNAPHSSLMAVLETCQTHEIDPLFVEHWEAEQSDGAVTQESARSAVP